MRRFILLLLLCVLPPQFVLAASVDAIVHVGSGHQHEAMLHSHEAAAESGPDAAGADESSSRSLAECGACHFFHSLAMPGPRAEFTLLDGVAAMGPNGRDAPHRHNATERPERPNWSALV